VVEWWGGWMRYKWAFLDPVLGGLKEGSMRRWEVAEGWASRVVRRAVLLPYHRLQLTWPPHPTPSSLCQTTKGLDLQALGSLEGLRMCLHSASEPLKCLKLHCLGARAPWAALGVALGITTIASALGHFGAYGAVRIHGCRGQ
jgi:hypothetical protein